MVKSNLHVKVFSEDLIEQADIIAVIGNLFVIGDSRPLNIADKKMYHILTATPLYLTKREKPG